MPLFRPLLPETPAGRLLATWDLRYVRDSRAATLAHGLLKVMVFTLPGTVGFFESLGLPGFLAYLVTFASNYDGIIQPAASISFGNQMDLTVGDFLQHFNGVPDVNVVACYVEGFRPGDGAKFIEEVRPGPSGIGRFPYASGRGAYIPDVAIVRVYRDSI